MQPRFEASLDRQHAGLGRKEQGYLRGLLFKDEKDALCSLCGRRLPVELLVAAHIKPRADCASRERRDFTHIAFALCLLGCDALYERGLVAVEKGGRIVVAKADSKLLARHLASLARRRCSAWTPDSAESFLLAPSATISRVGIQGISSLAPITAWAAPPSNSARPDGGWWSLCTAWRSGGSPPPV